MSLQMRPPSDVPEETARIARASFPKGNPYLTLRDELGSVYANQLFSALYSRVGQPAEAPWRLALVTVLQFAEGLSDRQAADAVRSRIDWKYLLGLSLDDPGFHYSILSEFRSRLIEGEAKQILLDELLEQFRQRKLLKARSQQRTDSTHILASVRNLNRLELVAETIRLSLNQLAVDAPEWLKTRAPVGWYERYSSRFENAHLPKTQQEREELAKLIGADGRQLLLWAYASESPETVSKHPAIEILRQIWLQQYYIQDEEIFWREKDNVPPTGKGIPSPFDLEARFGVKRQTEWLGYKAHFTEVCEAGLPHFVTHVETTPATVPDGSMTNTIHAALDAKDVLPSQHFLDMGYVDTPVLVVSQDQYGIEVIGPIQQDNTWQAQSEERLDITQFEINWQQQTVTCPNGKTNRHWVERADSTGHTRIYVDFRNQDCQPCPLRSKCTQSTTRPRSVSFKPQREYELLQWARQREKTPEFRESYKKRAGVEGTLSQGVRSFDLRRSRYIGQVKTHLQHILIAVALNLIRFVNWVNEAPLTSTRVTPFTKLGQLAL